PDPLLTRTDPGTPCGEYLRRFWQPVAFARDLGDVPRRIRIMGEDLVVFRDRSGRLGVLQLHCSHRGTSLEYGILQERGIRCCYHFTEAFGALAELEWQETPYGMIYVATRRIGELVWVRICDFMAPNVHQFTREIEEAASERIASRPVVIRWAVPVDDTRTLNFELAQVDPAWGLTPAQIAQPGFGQSADRPYDERQRCP